MHKFAYSIYNIGLGTADIVNSLICFDFVTISIHMFILFLSFIVTCTAVVWQLQISKMRFEFEFNGQFKKWRHGNGETEMTKTEITRKDMAKTEMVKTEMAKQK